MKGQNLARSIAIAGVCMLWVGLSADRADAAQTVHLWLTIDGNDIQGESTITSLGREGSIECSAFGENGYTPVNAASGLPSGARQHRPITIIKRVDKASPLLWKAWANHESVSAALFRFYRPAAAGGGQEEHFLSVLLENGYIVGMSTVSQDALVGGTSAPPVMESITFTFDTITWTYETNGATHTDTWGSP